MRIIGLIIVSALLFTSCKNKEKVVETANDAVEVVEEVTTSEPEIETEPIEEIYYERTPCFGRCPVFVLSIYSNGKATYEGKNFVDRIGTYKGDVSKEKIEMIKSKAMEIGYFELEKEYDNKFVTDLPAIMTMVSGKRVLNRYQGPIELKDLYIELDALIESIEWEAMKSKQN